jgi:hypothetical protein
LHYLISWFGRLVCYDMERNLLVHRHPQQIHPSVIPVRVHNDADGRLSYRLEGHDLRFVGRAACGKVGHGHPEDPVALQISGKPGRIVQLAADGMYLSSGPDGDVAASRSRADAWECFFLARERDLADLRHLLSHAWIKSVDASIVSPERIAVLEGFRLAFGDQTVQLAENLPMEFAERLAWADAPGEDKAFERSSVFFSTVLFSNTWRMEEVFLYRPLIYFGVIPLTNSASALS